MKASVIILPCLFFVYCGLGQNTFTARISNGNTKQILKGAAVVIPNLHVAAITDTSGLISLFNIPNGTFTIRVNYVGYTSFEQVYSFPLPFPNRVTEIELQPQAGELAEVTVQSTRISQNLGDVPTRIEALPLEELDEKTTMRPGDIKMLLGEATGIHVQQLSAVSGNASFRIQGLDSRYTQLLQDGMPLYGGFSGNLSLLQISPLDFKQVEFIKGSASTLYGGGAIAGLINLISKTPDTLPELTFLLNGTTAKGVDASGYYSRQFKHIGTTVLGSYNYNAAYDPGGSGLSAVPQTKRFTINPKLFFNINEHNNGWIGVNTTYEDRYGGDMQVIAGNADSTHQYFERNKVLRFFTQMAFTHIISAGSQVNFKNSIGYFDRQLNEPGFAFSGKQVASFSEVNYVKKGVKTNWVAGVNIITDHFMAKAPQNALGYTLTTFGAFVQNTFKVVNWFSIESGLRLDKNTPAPAKTPGPVVLPRVNALFRLSKALTSRIGGGLGYKMPSLFNDVAEQEGYRNIQPLNLGNTQAEQSYGLNGDLNYRGRLGEEATISINQLFFYTNVNRPLILQNNTFINAPGYLTTQGAETNIKLVIDELAFYLGYTHTTARQHFNGISSIQPLMPETLLNFDATYEIEGSFRFGVESFYTGPQLLSNGTLGKGFVTFGLLLQKMWKHLDVFINAENLTDQRQTRWGSIYTGSLANPVFKDIYAPLDGAVVNAGIRVKLLNK